MRAFSHTTLQQMRSRESLHVVDSDDTYMLSHGIRDASVFERDSTPDAVATDPPFSAFTQAHKSSQPNNTGLVLRSSPRKVIGVSDVTIYAFLINRDELIALLNSVGSDLRSYEPNMSTTDYRYNSTNWSFSLIAPHDRIPYAAIQAVVSRYLMFAVETSVVISPDIVWTRAGALCRANFPIASVVITRASTTDAINDSACSTRNATVDRDPSQTEPTEIITVIPESSTCSYQVVDQFAALSPFSNAAHPKRDGFEAQVFAHAAQTIYGISVRLWRDPDGIPVRMNQFAGSAVILIAINSLAPDELDRDFTMETRIFSQIDSGVHNLGHMKVRFLMKISPPKARGHLITLEPKVWRELVALLQNPLEAIVDSYYIWAIEGEIFENGTVIGHWELKAVCY